MEEYRNEDSITKSRDNIDGLRIPPMIIVFLHYPDSDLSCLLESVSRLWIFCLLWLVLIPASVVPQCLALISDLVLPRSASMYSKLSKYAFVANSSASA